MRRGPREKHWELNACMDQHPTKFSLYPPMFPGASLPLRALLTTSVPMTTPPPILHLQLWSVFSCSESCNWLSAGHFDSGFSLNWSHNLYYTSSSSFFVDLRHHPTVLVVKTRNSVGCLTSPSPSFSTAHCTHTYMLIHTHAHSLIPQSHLPAGYLSNISRNQLLSSVSQPPWQCKSYRQ